MSDASFAHGLIGVTLDGRYRLDAVLGEGGMGSVFRATHLAMDRKVAVKLLKPHLTGDQIALERFSREARATLKVDSPHAVKALDFGVTPLGDCYMVLEYLDGRTVQRELEIDGPFAPPRVAHIARQALHALGAAHAQGLIHRDVKPENLLLMRSGSDGDYTKILDFGVAKLMQGAAGDPAQLALTAAGMVFGTPEFMSPEQACGLPLDGRSDLYSLAATMFVMLTGTTLFEGATAIEWLTHHVRTPAPPLAMVRPELAAHPGLDALVQRCLAKQRELRPGTAAEMADLLAELEPALARTPVSPPPRTASKPGPIHASGYVEVLRDPGSTLLPAVAAPPGAPPIAAGPAARPPPHAGSAFAAGPAAPLPPALDPGAGAARHSSPRLASLVDRSAAARAADPAPGAREAASSSRSRRRLALWVGGISVASAIGVALGLSMVGPESDAGSGAGSPAEPGARAAAAGADQAAVGPAAGGDATSPAATAPAAPTPVRAGTRVLAEVATEPAGAPTPVSAAPGVGPPPAGGTASPGSAASTPPAPPSTMPRGAAAPAGPAPARPTGAATRGPAHRPPRAVAAGDPRIEELLKQAEDAYRKQLKPLLQLGPAGEVLQAQPGNLRARFLAGDALIRDGDIDNGCKYLAMARALPAARSRARAAGCPGD